MLVSGNSVWSGWGGWGGRDGRELAKPLALVLVLALVFSGALVGCDSSAGPAEGSATQSRSVSSEEGVSSSPASSSSVSSPAFFASSSAASSSSTAADGAIPSQVAPRAEVFDLAAAPVYAGMPSAEVNGGIPFFSDDDRARAQAGAFEDYAPLDALGRCGAAFALVGRETMPTEPRGSIGMVRPSGWHTARYDGIVDGNYLYNRCHLIGYQLTGENANERNLITGTRTMNVEGMLPFEERVASYVERTGNHVLYRSTPVFESGELVARGVLLEAESLEDVGAGLRFCVWCYNVEPGIEVDYATGESKLAEETAAVDAPAAAGTAGEADAATTAGTAVAAAAAGAAEAAASEPEPASAVVDAAPNSAPVAVRTYVLNANTRKFHYPDCPSVADMAEHNKIIVESTHDQVVAEGYDPCKRCNP